MSGQKTRHQKLNSYLVMNSLGDKNLSTQIRNKGNLDIDTEFPTIFNKTCTYITFKIVVKHRQQLNHGYPRG